MRSYIKKHKKTVMKEGLGSKLVCEIASFISNKKFLALMLIAISVPLIFVSVSKSNFDKFVTSNEDMIQLMPLSQAVTETKKSVITIPQSVVKQNPFLPYRNIGETPISSDVPGFALVEPPSQLNTNSDAARVMDTMVSGILYDKFSPSAIINIEGNDYLVKKGDVVNNYKVLNIVEDSVTVKLGENIYKAGIGEILTEGALNYNNVSNLNNKFGGMQ